MGVRFAQDLGTNFAFGPCLCPSSPPRGASQPILLPKETSQGGAYPVPSPPAVQDDTAWASFPGLPFTLVRTELTSFQTSPCLAVTFFSERGEERSGPSGLWERRFPWGLARSWGTAAVTLPFLLPPPDLWTGERMTLGWVLHTVSALH